MARGGGSISACGIDECVCGNHDDALGVGGAAENLPSEKSEELR